MLIELLLAGDNAVVIALSVKNLRRRQPKLDLTDQPCGRPTQPVDALKQSREKQLAQAQRDNAKLGCKMAIEDALSDVTLSPGMDRAEKMRASSENAP
jgi:hypothetical protein